MEEKHENEKENYKCAVSCCYGCIYGCGCGKQERQQKNLTANLGEKTLEVWVPPLDDATEKNWGDLFKRLGERK